MKTYIKSALFVCALSLALPVTVTAEQVYGWQLMTEQERAEHRQKMQSMKTAEERERYRLEHHKKMEKRAKQQGVTLPAEPQSRGGKMRGFGSGSGSGSGGGR